MASLENLRYLAKGISRNKVKNIHVIGNTNSSSTIFDEFYHALLEDRFTTDDDYAHYFYPNSPNNQAFYKLKDRLFDRLVNTIFFIDTNHKDFISLQKVYYKSYKNTTAVKLMLGRGIRLPAIELAKKTLKKCLNFGFPDLTIELSRHLRMHYGSFDPNNKKYEYYSNLISENLKIHNQEIKAEEYLYSLFLDHHNRTNLDKKFYRKIKKRKKKINSFLNKEPCSYRLTLYSYLFLYTYYELSGKWKKLYNTCNNVIKKGASNPRLFTFTILNTSYYRKLKSSFVLQKYSGIEALKDKCLLYLNEGTHNWFSVKDLYIKIQLHNKEYEEASKTLEIIKKFKKDNFYYGTWKENVKIYDAFLHYLRYIGKLRHHLLENENPPTFRLQKFLNEVPNHSKDKKGSNVTILILQILFLLEQRKYDNIIDRTESLRVYNQRYLKEDSTYRSNCFIKMLLCLPAGNFERSEVASKAQEYLDRLHAMPIKKAKQSAELEVMPYEMLWEFVLESLDRKAISN